MAADRTPFYGIKLPPEVKSLIQLSKKVEHSTMRKVLKSKLCVKYEAYMKYRIANVCTWNSKIRAALCTIRGLEVEGGAGSVGK